MAYNDSFRSAQELTAIARAACNALLNSFKLPAYLPNVQNFTLSYDFDVNQLTYADTAKFRTFDVETRFGREVSTQRKTGQLPPIGEKLRLTEFDQLSLYGQTDAIGLKMEDKAELVGAHIGARLALAQGQAVETGIVTIAENGLALSVDFGRQGGNTVTAGTVWTTISAPALTDLTTWLAVYRAINGFSPAVAEMSSAVMAALQKNTSIILAATQQASANAPAIISQDAVRAMFLAYGFGEIEINDDQVNVDGSNTRVIANNKLIWLPARGGLRLGGVGGSLGSTQFGIPSEAIDPKFGIADAEKPGVFAADFDGDDPTGHNVLGSAIALPVLSSANATFAAAVI